MQNDMRDRLIELIHRAITDWEHGDVSEKIADKLLASGVIVPPCKVSDELYAISNSRIAKCMCIEITQHTELTICVNFICDYDCIGCPFDAWGQDYSGEHSCQGEYGFWCFSLADFGKTVFFTREAAEQALKERESNE